MSYIEKKFLPRKHIHRGMTFIEMLVAMAMATFALVAVGSFTVTFYRTHAYEIEQSLAINSARKGVERMVRDVREATFSDEGGFPISSIDAYEIVFFSDIDRDEKIERVHFFLSDGALLRGQTESTGNPPTYPVSDDTENIVSDHVRNETHGTPIFRYYDTHGDEITDYALVTDVAFITVNVIVNINPDRLPYDFNLQSSASLRNLRIGGE
jgi:prepilin-type N-terminal cleavage/methylation domain-containing protein